MKGGAEPWQTRCVSSPTHGEGPGEPFSSHLLPGPFPAHGVMLDWFQPIAVTPFPVSGIALVMSTRHTPGQWDVGGLWGMVRRGVSGKVFLTLKIGTRDRHLTAFCLQNGWARKGCLALFQQPDHREGELPTPEGGRVERWTEPASSLS